MKERIESNPRSDGDLARDSDRHRQPMFAIHRRKWNEQTTQLLRQDSLATPEQNIRRTVEQNGDEKSHKKES